MFPSTLKRKASVYQFSQFDQCFRKARFSWRINVHDRSNRKTSYGAQTTLRYFRSGLVIFIISICNRMGLGQLRINFTRKTKTQSQGLSILSFREGLTRTQTSLFSLWPSDFQYYKKKTKIIFLELHNFLKPTIYRMPQQRIVNVDRRRYKQLYSFASV